MTTAFDWVAPHARGRLFGILSAALAGGAWIIGRTGRQPTPPGT